MNFKNIKLTNDFLVSIGQSMVLNQESLSMLYRNKVIDLYQVALAEWTPINEKNGTDRPKTHLFASQTKIVYIDCYPINIIEIVEFPDTIAVIKYTEARNPMYWEKICEEFRAKGRTSKAIPESICQFDTSGRLVDGMFLNAVKSNTVNFMKTVYSANYTEVTYECVREFDKEVVLDSDWIATIDKMRPAMSEYGIWACRTQLSNQSAAKLDPGVATNLPIQKRDMANFVSLNETTPNGAKVVEYFDCVKTGNVFTVHRETKDSKFPMAFTCRNKAGQLLIKRTPGAIFNYEYDKDNILKVRSSMSIKTGEQHKISYKLRRDEEGNPVDFLCAKGLWDQVPVRYSKLSFPVSPFA
ncbi:hypothetical protein [Vibrio phage vB_pir03]|nr:hypothetical protein [Vibrio phage vB_pir03]